MALAPFTVQPNLVAASGLYRNNRLIADQVLPRIAPVGTQTFKWLLHTMADGYTIPDTRVGRTSRPRSVEFSATEQSGMTVDYGLEVAVPNADVRNSQGQSDAVARVATDPRTKATLLATDLLLLDREVRVANLVFTLGTYPSANRATLSGSSQWSHPDSDPIGAIHGAADGMMVRPNVGVMGRQVFTALRRHPKIVSAVLGNSGTSGVVSAQDIARFFDLDRIEVGEAFLNTARPGQAASMSRVWGKHFAMLYLDPNGGPMDMPSFGWTQPWGERVAGTIEDPNMGLRGGEWVRVGESVAEVVAASAMGYLFRDAVA
jgi:hypothetical protein